MPEFHPNTDPEAEEPEELRRLGEAGGLIAARTLIREDFSDWEQPRG